jgi:hypothetical protein
VSVRLGDRELGPDAARGRARCRLLIDSSSRLPGYEDLSQPVVLIRPTPRATSTLTSRRHRRSRRVGGSGPASASAVAAAAGVAIGIALTTEKDPDHTARSRPRDEAAPPRQLLAGLAARAATTDGERGKAEAAIAKRRVVARLRRRADGATATRGAERAR